MATSMRRTLHPRRAGRVLGGPKMPRSGLWFSGAQTWYRSHPGAAMAVATSLFVFVTVLHWFQDGSGQAITVLYVLPIALLAVTFGFRGGLVAAAVGFGLFAILQVLHSSGDIDADGWAVRAVAMFLLGALLGRATDHTLASERATLAEQRRRCQFEEQNHRYAEAIEISDSLVQKMVAAKWMAEQGRSEESAQVLASTIAEGERMVAGLLPIQMAAPAGHLVAELPLFHDGATEDHR